MFYNPLDNLISKILMRGGFVNSHSHLDRAYTLVKEDMEINCEMHLHDKWKLVDKIKSESSEEDYYDRIMHAIFEQKRVSVCAIATFIDIDEISEYRALNAAIKAKAASKKLWNIDLVIACQTLKGVLNKKEQKRIERVIDQLDIIGSLPGSDKGREEEHLDVVLNWSKSTGKLLHAHVDQLNTVREKETEMLARNVIRFGLEGRAVAIHSISLASHPSKYRSKVYEISKDAGLGFISCPTAWIDSRRSDLLSVEHNSVTPIDELVRNNLTVGIGSDNIVDVYKPYSNGNMLTELRVLLEANHFYDIKELIKIATTNGRKLIGL